MKIIGDLSDFKSTLRSFIHGKIKQTPVICFKFNCPAPGKDPVIAAQIFRRRETPAGMSFLGPGIGKIEIDFVYLSVSKKGVDQFRVSAYKNKILKLQFLLLFEAAQKDAGIFFNTDIINLRMFLRKLHDKTSLAGSDFQMERFFISKNRSPVSAMFFRFLYDPGTCSDRIARTRYISQTHRFPRC